ncbi:hypothetical protein SAMN05216284_12139 [Micromonospora sediminimaris]|uniref:Uncharacterized protein n=1 Tax=Micromonospora sediminimaris TaxID=547162 RepID=A0A9W5UUI8_9ACTN|nr:hypothetical protein Vse01_40470 [Micromonospora sediminimaris]SFD65881.1 hypothetical protein SAMN05216284_12139 [Micromonospora sediminimaris]
MSDDVPVTEAPTEPTTQARLPEAILADVPVVDTAALDPPTTDLPGTAAAVGDEVETEEVDTRPLDELLDDLYHGQERISQVDIYRRAVAAELPAQLLSRLNALPQGEYAVDEVTDLLGGSAG